MLLTFSYACSFSLSFWRNHLFLFLCFFFLVLWIMIRACHDKFATLSSCGVIGVFSTRSLNWVFLTLLFCLKKLFTLLQIRSLVLSLPIKVQFFLLSFVYEMHDLNSKNMLIFYIIYFYFTM